MTSPSYTPAIDKAVLKKCHFDRGFFVLCLKYYWLTFKNKSQNSLQLVVFTNVINNSPESWIPSQFRLRRRVTTFIHIVQYTSQVAEQEGTEGAGVVNLIESQPLAASPDNRRRKRPPLSTRFRQVLSWHQLLWRYRRCQNLSLIVKISVCRPRTWWWNLY